MNYPILPPQELDPAAKVLVLAAGTLSHPLIPVLHFPVNRLISLPQELEVQHPAAKLLVLAARAQQEEVGDGSNTVISLGGSLLTGAEELIRSGLHPSDIISGYGKAITKVSEGLSDVSLNSRSLRRLLCLLLPGACR